MNQEFKDKWLAALQSGEYVQGVGALSVDDKSIGLMTYCCLGVACDLLGGVWSDVGGKGVDDHLIVRDVEIDGKQYDYTATILLPFAGDTDNQQAIGWGDDRPWPTLVAEMNDETENGFIVIADWIEKHVPVDF
jgi:hypothetical protein